MTSAKNPSEDPTSAGPWEVYAAAIPFAGCIYGRQRVRMAVVGLGDGDLLVISPGVPRDERAWEQLAAWGKPRFLLAPNHFHHMGIPAWVQRFPDVTVVAAARALPRLHKQLPGHRLADLSALQAVLPDHVRVFGPPMAKQGETWVAVTTSAGVAWFVTDALVNEARLPKGALGLLMRLVGFRTGLMTNPFFKRFFLANRAAYKAWMKAELERDQPTLFVPSHGQVVRGANVCELLQHATDAA